MNQAIETINYMNSEVPFELPWRDVPIVEATA